MTRVFFILAFTLSITTIGAKNPQWLINEMGKYVLVDSLHKNISEKSYDFGYDFYDSFIVPVCNQGYWGVINIHGKEIIPCIYESVDCNTYLTHSDNVLHGLSDDSYIISCKKKGKFYAYDKEGNVLIKKCSYICNLLRGNILFSQGRFGRLKLLSLRDGNIYAIEDKKLEFSSFSYFDEKGICVVARIFNRNSLDESYLFGAIDTKGRYVVPCIYKNELDVMEKVGRSERSFYFHNK